MPKEYKVITRQKEHLKDFDLSQLQILFKHLTLGQDHLKSLLTTRQLEDLFNWGELREEHKKQILATRVEKFGNMSLIINTILTSTFGAWMGLSGCIGCGLGSYKVLTTISLLAFFVSGMIGFISLNMTQRQATLAIDKQRLLNLQLRVLQAIIDKITEKANAQIHYLNSAIFILKTAKDSDEEKPIFKFIKINEFYEWFENLEATLKQRMDEVQDSSAYEFYQTQIQQNCYLIKKTFAKHVKYLENLSLTKQKFDRQIQIMPSLPFLKVLTNPAYGIPRYRSMNSLPWIKRNFDQLLLGLTPTIWGGFASMFVFVGGIPNIARELGFVEVANFLIQPKSRIIEVTIALLVTSYFAFSFIYSSKKNWQRQNLLEQTQKKLSDLETISLESTHKLNILYKVKNYTQKIISIFNALKHREN